MRSDPKLERGALLPLAAELVRTAEVGLAIEHDRVNAEKDLCKIFHTQHRAHGRAKGGLLQRADRKTHLVEMLGRDHGPEDDRCEAERLSQSVHMGSQRGTANGGGTASGLTAHVSASLRATDGAEQNRVIDCR